MYKRKKKRKKGGEVAKEGKKEREGIDVNDGHL
jgi:hypothetical protein